MVAYCPSSLSPVRLHSIHHLIWSFFAWLLLQSFSPVLLHLFKYFFTRSSPSFDWVLLLLILQALFTWSLLLSIQSFSSPSLLNLVLLHLIWSFLLVFSLDPVFLYSIWSFFTRSSPSSLNPLDQILLSLSSLDPVRLHLIRSFFSSFFTWPWSSFLDPPGLSHDLFFSWSSPSPVRLHLIRSFFTCTMTFWMDQSDRSIAGE